MAIHMTLQSADISDDALQKLTQEMVQTLNSETDAQAALSQTAAGKGAKGDPVALGQIILTALTSGTVVALFEVFKTFFERKPSLEINFKRPDGADFKINASQLGKAQMDKSLALAQNFFEERHG